MVDAPPAEQEKCANCKFWRQNHCHANPPYLVLSSVAAHARAIVAWPETASTDWCGRFVFKGEAVPQVAAADYPADHPVQGDLGAL